MSLTLPTAPQGVQQVVNYALNKAHSSGQFTLRGPSGGAAVVTPVAPHQVFVIGLNSLADNTGIQAAKLVGWRTLVLQGKSPLAAVEFSGGGGARDYKSINEGSQVQATSSAVTMAEGLAQVKDRDFEMRFLQMPSIYLASIWLHRIGEELFVPLDPAPNGFKAYNLYAEKDFFQLAGALAARRLQFDERPKEPPKEPPAAALATA